MHLDSVSNRLLEIDKNGFYLIELLNWINDDPLYLAEKVVSLNNPFKILDFKNRYNEYVDNIRHDRGDYPFVQKEDSINTFLDESLLNLNLSSIVFEDIANDRLLEQRVEGALINTLDALIMKQSKDCFLLFANKAQTYFNSKINEIEPVVSKHSIKKIKTYSADNITIALLKINKHLAISIMNTTEYYEFCENLAWNDTDFIDTKFIFHKA